MGSSTNSNGGVPPGFRFHPTDEELLQYYLKKKVSFQKFDMDVIREVDLNKMEPWELQERCKIGSTPQNEWYFFSHKDRKYPTGSRTNRATSAGFWKATGRDKCIRSTYKKIGMRKTLVFYKGRAPNGQKTDWIMHEYRLEDGDDIQPNHNEDGWVICRVFKKKNLFKIGNGGGGSTTSIDSGHQPGNNTGISTRNHNQASRTNYINMDTHNYYDLLDQPAFELNKPVDLALRYSGHVVSSQAQSLSMVPSGGEATTSNHICIRDQTDGANMAMGINYGWAMTMAPAPHHHHHQEQNQHDPSKGMSFQIEEGDPSAQPVPQMTNQLSPRGEMDFWGYTAAK